MSLLVGARAVYEFLKVALSRFAYPFELEWMEGGMLMHVARIREGKPLYSEPSPEFMPFLYGPGYSYAGAFCTALFGFGFGPLRLLSLVSTVVASVCLFWLIRRETEDVFAGLAGVALFVSTFSLNGGWFDLVRADSLALALGLAATVVVRSALKPAALALAGGIAALSVLTKQTMLVFVPALVFWSVKVHGRRGIGAFCAGLVGTVGVIAAALEVQSDGWFSYYVFELPLSHGHGGREHLATRFWIDELARALPMASTCAILFFAGLPLGLDRSSRIFFAVLCGSLIAGAYMSRLHMGSFENDLMPAHAALSILFALVLGGRAAAEGGGAAARRVACGAVVLAQLVLVTPVDWQRFVPTKADVRAGEKVVAHIRSYPGEVLVANHPHLAWMAGKRPHAHQMAMVDVFAGPRDPRGVRKLLTDRWSPLFERAHFSAVILDNDWYVFLDALKSRYDEHRKIRLKRSALMPKTGTPCRPQQVFRPRDSG